MARLCVPILLPILLMLSACGAAQPAAPQASKPAPSQPPELAEVKMGVTETATGMPLYLGLDEGIFQKHGIKLTLVSTSAPVAVAGLSSGDIQVSTFGGTIIDADPDGAKLAFVGALLTEFAQFAVYGKSAYKSVKDLTGTTIAGSSPSASATLAARAMFKRNGMDPDKDVKWIFAQTTQAQLAALVTGQVDASVVSWPTYLEAQKAGFVKLGDAKDLHIPAASSSLSVARSWVRDNPNVVRRYLEAMIEAISIVNGDKAKAEASLGSHLKVSDQTALDDGYARYTPFPNPPYMTAEAVQEAIDDTATAAVKTHKPADYIDNGPLDAIVKNR
ncbi:MAG TPA: ABC transporter substrate-binding protein [Chloroflexota bacterium]